MGNCFGNSSDESNPSTILPTFSSGTSGVASSEAGFSGRSNSCSSAGNSRGFGGGGEVFEERDGNGEILETPNLRIFSFSELKSATRNFRHENLLGEGGFGRVYKGSVDDKGSRGGGKIVAAIKKLNSESLQGLEEWQSEVNFLGRLSHPNLVKLLGYCWEDMELLLVYEYMPKGSLENHLFRRAIEPLTWRRRLSIALGAARGLAFLHNLDEQLIYRDFKASNILLDPNYNAKLSDFGLAKLGPSDENSHVTTRVMGTYGYAAPEYVATGHLYVKSDVYGFGVVLLELLTGLRAVDVNRPSGQVNLVEWAKPRLPNKTKLRNIMDSRIEGQYSNKAAFEAARLTLHCLGTEPKSRPSMKEVVNVLQQIEAIEGRSNQRRSISTRSRDGSYAEQTPGRSPRVLGHHDGSYAEQTPGRSPRVSGHRGDLNHLRSPRQR